MHQRIAVFKYVPPFAAFYPNRRAESTLFPSAAKTPSQKHPSWHLVTLMPSSLHVRPTTAGGTSRSRAIVKASTQVRLLSATVPVLRASVSSETLPGIMAASVTQALPSLMTFAKT